MEGAWPLVGRDAEVGLLQGCLERRWGMVVAGAAGVGKTRLAREAEVLGRASGYAVERVAATLAVSDVPLGVFVHLDTSEPTRAGGLGTSPLASIRRALLKRAAGRPLLLVVDDAHVLDSVSAGLVHQLATAGDAVVVATLRSRSPASDSIVALWKDELCERLELQALARNEVIELLERVLGGRVDSRTGHQLWWASQGNLLFLRELVRDGLDRGVLKDEDGRWQWTGEFRAPTRVTELVAAQLDSLGHLERRALELVSLAEPLEWEVLARLVAVDANESLAGQGLIVVAEESGSRRARLAHPLVGEVARDLLVNLRRQRLLQELASAVNESMSSKFDVLRRVTWLIEAGQDADASSLVSAGRQCVLIDPPRAERFARLAIEHGAGTEGIVVLAQNLMFCGRAEEAETLLSRAVENADESDRVSLATMRANNLTFGLGRAPEAVALVDRMSEQVPSEQFRVAMKAQKIPMLLFAGRVTDAVDQGEPLWADTAIATGERLRAATALVAALALRGRPLTGLALAQEALALLGEGHEDVPFAAGQLATGVILCHHRLGHLDVADQIATMGREQGLRDGNDLVRGTCALQLGVGAHWRGAVRTAIEHLREAVDALQRSDVGFLGWATDELRACASVAGVAQTAREPEWRHPLYQPERLRLEAQVAAASGNRAQAAELDEQAVTVALESGMAAQAAFALFDLARVGQAATAAPRLASLIATLEGDLFATMASAALALAGAEPHALEEAAVWFEARGFQLFAAELARAAARAYQDAGLNARRVRADRTADRLAAGCEGGRSAMLERTATLGEADLTQREHDVAQLAADGHSNAAIADRLGVSVRTVETHLQRAYTKLGLHGRAELKEALAG